MLLSKNRKRETRNGEQEMSAMNGKMKKLEKDNLTLAIPVTP